jgi:carbon-monoxide dehydrogenase large subunit
LVTFRSEAVTFPYSCHVCEVEIDPDTGKIDIVGYAAVADVGVVINPLLLEGQIHGGVAQGIGQALMENIVYESGSGQMLSGSFMDYCMPRADDFRSFEVFAVAATTETNPLGVKGAGELGIVGALPAVVNAVVDALSKYAIVDIEMPITSERVWKTIRNARQTGGRHASSPHARAAGL